MIHYRALACVRRGLWLAIVKAPGRGGLAEALS